MSEPTGRQVCLNDGINSAALCQLVSGAAMPVNGYVP